MVDGLLSEILRKVVRDEARPVLLRRDSRLHASVLLHVGLAVKAGSATWKPT